MGYSARIHTEAKSGVMYMPYHSWDSKGIPDQEELVRAALDLPTFFLSSDIYSELIKTSPTAGTVALF